MITSVVFNSIETVSYNYSGQYLISKIDENNNTYAQFNYATVNGITSATSNSLVLNGNPIWQYNFNYNPSSQQNTVTQSNGFNQSISYTQVNGIKKATSINLNGYYSSYGYDSNGNLINNRDYNGNSTYYIYDSLNRLTNKTLPNGKSISITWSSGTNVPQVISESSANGTRTTTFTYDNYLNVASKTVAGAGGTMVWSYSWTADGRLLSVKNPDGSGVQYGYYSIDSSPRSGLVNTITNALGQTITINSYDNRGNATSITGINGITKTMTYDMRGRVLTESVNNITNSYSYDMVGNLLSINYANGYVLAMTYDGIHRLTNISDNMGGAETVTYDPVTNKVLNQSVYQNNNLVMARNNALDALGRITRTWKGTTKTTQSMNYSSFIDLPNSTSDANGNNTSYYQDGVGNITSKNSPDNGGSYSYDVDSNLKNATINSQTTYYFYDDFGRITQLSSPDSGNHTISYNTSNRISTHTDANGSTHTQSYDAGGNLVAISHANGSNTITENFSYDGANRISQMTDYSGSTSYGYNNLGLLSSKTQVVNGKSFGVQYNYDNVGQLSSMTYPSGLTVNYSRSNGFLTGISVAGTQVVSNVYYNSMLKQPVSWSLNGGQVNVSYTADGLITGFNDGLLNQSITTDNVNNVSSVNDNQGTNISTSYSASYALTNFTSSSKTLAYTYYNNLNLEMVRGTNTNLFFDVAQSANKPQDIQTPDSYYYSYDNNGNTLNDDLGNYTYDLKNNMITSTRKMSGVTLTGNYLFNAMNQRVAKSINNVITYYVYNESHQLIGEYDNNGNVISEYVYFGLRPVAVRTNGQTYIVHTDYLSTPRIVTSSGGSTVWQWQNLDAFGNNPANGSISFNLRFAGQYYDYESGLHYNNYRVYNPEIGRYMQSDPTGLNAGSNTYNYVGKNPLSMVDPLGLWSKQGDAADINFFPSGSLQYKVSQSMGIPNVIANISPNMFVIAGHMNSSGLENDTSCWFSNQCGSPSGSGREDIIAAYDHTISKSWLGKEQVFRKNNVDTLLDLMHKNGYKDGTPIFFAGCNSGSDDYKLLLAVSKKVNAVTIGVIGELMYQQTGSNSGYVYPQFNGIKDTNGNAVDKYRIVFPSGTSILLK